MTAVLIPTADESGWLEARRQGITASEIAVVMGLSPWSSPYALYHRKAGTLPEQDQSDAMALGKHMESFVAAEFAKRHPEFWVDGCGTDLYAHPGRPWQMATPDRLVHEIPCLCDLRSDGCSATTAGIDCPMHGNPGYLPSVVMPGDPLAVLECKIDGGSDEWGEDGTDEIPVHYRCQVLWQMDVLGVTTGYVACLLWNRRKVRVYELTRDSQAEHDLELMLNEANDFLYRIRMGYPPDVDWRPATADALKRLHPDVEDRDAHIGRQLEISYRSAVRRYREAAERKKLMENRLRAAMGSARRAVARGTYGPDNGRVVIATRQVYDLAAKTIERSACTVDKLVPAKVKDPS